jgi:hypothetical protein
MQKLDLHNRVDLTRIALQHDPASLGKSIALVASAESGSLITRFS